MIQLSRVAELSQSMRTHTNPLHTLAVVMREVGEFCDAVIASQGLDDRFSVIQPNHDLMKGADVVAEVISNATIVTLDSPTDVVSTILNEIGNVASNEHSDPVAVATYSDDNLVMLTSAVGRLSSSTMQASNLITSEQDTSTQLYYHSALVIYNIITTIQSIQPTLSMSDVVVKICELISTNITE